MSAIDRMKDEVAKALMNAHGWNPEENKYATAEWDPNNPESQFSMMREDAEIAVDVLLDTIDKLAVEEEEGLTEYVFGPIDDEDDEDEEPKEQSLFDEYGHPRRDDTVTTTNTTFIFMDAGTGKARYVSDVREWLKRVDTAGIPDDTEIEGTLHLSYDVEAHNSERIECMECGFKDMLITTHACKGHNA
jgi:hypothetical protein